MMIFRQKQNGFATECGNTASIDPLRVLVSMPGVAGLADLPLFLPARQQPVPIFDVRGLQFSFKHMAGLPITEYPRPFHESTVFESNRDPKDFAYDKFSVDFSCPWLLVFWSVSMSEGHGPRRPCAHLNMNSPLHIISMMSFISCLKIIKSRKIKCTAECQVCKKILEYNFRR